VIGRLTELVKGATALQPLYERLHRVSLIGMNYGRGGGFATSGEPSLLALLAGRARESHTPFVVLDVGANTGEYTRAVLHAFAGRAIVHAFEPQPSAYLQLQREFGGDSRVHLTGAAIGSRDGEVRLYSPAPGSTLASLHRQTVADWEAPEIAEEVVPLRALDSYCAEVGIERLDLLKIDVEGHELEVLRGAARLLEEGRITGIQWEFGPAHVVSRTFMRDFVDLLGSRYRIYRLLPNGLRELRYSPLSEIFFTANFYAEHR
jgi:FkbM family methyltransferase